MTQVQGTCAVCGSVNSVNVDKTPGEIKYTDGYKMPCEICGEDTKHNGINSMPGPSYV